MTKKLLFTLLSVFMSVMTVVGQVTQSVNVTQPGGLSAAIGSNLKTVTDLTLMGIINATDFQTIKQMTALKNLDMSKVSVVDNTIPANAFAGFKGTVDLPSSLKTLGDRSFFKSNMTSLVLPEGLETIGVEAFRESNLTTSLIMPSTLTDIRDLAFWGVKYKVDFSKSQKSLKKVGWAFVSNYSGSTILDFSDFTNLKTMGIGSWNGVPSGGFVGYLGHVILPKNLENLPSYAFAGFKGTVDLPSSLRTLGDRSFFKSNMTSLVLPEGLETIGVEAFRESNLTTSLIMPSTLTDIRDLAFWGVKYKVDFSKSQKSLKNVGWAFVSNYSGSTILDFSDFTNLKTMGVGSWNGVPSGGFVGYLGHVILPKNLENLPSYAFAGFKGTVDLPSSLKTLGDHSFFKSNMTNLVLPEGLETIGVEAFRESNLTTSLIMPSTLTDIRDLAFWGVKYKVDFSKSQKSLKNVGWAFVSNYSGSTILDFSDFTNLKTMGVGSWNGVPSGGFVGYLGHVILPKNLENLPSYAFASFKGTVDLPQGLKTIGNYAFLQSTIKSIDLPSSVTSIGNNAFFNASQLDTIISRNTTPPALGSNVFAGVNKETTQLIVPESSIKLYGTADQWKDFLDVKSTMPKELYVKYSFDGEKFIDYHAVRIGEYYWIDENFHHYAPKSFWSGERGDEINYPMTQSRLNKYMPFVYLDSLDYQVNIEDFNKSYGLHYHWYSASYIQEYGNIYKGGKIEKGWGLPSAGDAQQLFAMAPSYDEPYVNGPTVSFGLGAHLGDNPMAFDIAPKTVGSPYRTYWFTSSTELTSEDENLGFKLMPNGSKLNADNDIWKNGLLDPYTGDTVHIGNKADIYHLFYSAGFWLKNQQYAYIHDYLTIGNITWHWMGIRYTRRLTDEELGYKLYKNDAKEDIIQLNLVQTPPAGYTELEPGYLRGYYVKYIINGENPNMTPADLYYKVKHFTDKYRPKEETSTRSLSADDVVIPFRTSSEVSIYPNPVQDVLNVSGEGVEKISLYDLSGRQLQSVSNASSIQMSGLTAGTYIVRVQTASGESVHKVMKK